MFLRKTMPVLIYRGQDEAGRPIMKIEQDQVLRHGRTGHYLDNPDVAPSENMVDKAIPIGQELAEGDWFYPSKACQSIVTNAALDSMYDENGAETNAQVVLDTPDKGRMQILHADMEMKRGIMSLMPTTARIKDNSITRMQGQKGPGYLRQYEAAVKKAGGKEAVRKECELRQVMCNQKIYADYDTIEAARAEGQRVHSEIVEMHDADTAGFTEAVNKLGNGQISNLDL